MNSDMGTKARTLALAMWSFSMLVHAQPLDQWTLRGPLLSSNHLFGVTFGKDLFVAVGSGGTIVTSGDGANWIERASGTSQTLRDIAWGNGQFVAVGANGTILISSNGVIWATQSSPTADLLVAVAFGDAMFVAVSENGTILSSGDALAWGDHGSTSSHFRMLSDVTYGNGSFVAVGLHFCELRCDPSEMFVVATNRGIIVVTENSRGLCNVAYGNGRFVVTARSGRGSGTTYVSSDGAHWIQGAVGLYYPPLELAYGNGTFVAVSRFFAIDSVHQGPFEASSDGITWTIHPSGLEGCVADDGCLNKIAYGNHSFVAVGADGVILQSATVVRLSLRVNPVVELTISGPTNRSYGIEWTAHLPEPNPWRSLGTVTKTNETQTFADPDGTNASRRFYRALLLP